MGVPGGDSGRGHGTYTPGLGRLLLSPPKVTAAALANISVARITEPSRPWEAAFTGGIGVSAFRDPFVKSGGGNPAAQSSFNSYTPPLPSLSAASGAPSKGFVSGVEPGIAFFGRHIGAKTFF